MGIDFSDIILNHHGTDQPHAQLAFSLCTIVLDHPQVSGWCLPSAYCLATVLGINWATVTRGYRQLKEDQGIDRQSLHGSRHSTSKRPRMSSTCLTLGIMLPARFAKMIGYDNGMCLKYFEGILVEVADSHLSTIMLILPDFFPFEEGIRVFNKILEYRPIGVSHLGYCNCRNDRSPSAVLHNEHRLVVLILASLESPNVEMVHGNPSVGAQKLTDRFVALEHRSVGIVLYCNGFDNLGVEGLFIYDVFQCDMIIRAFLCDSDLVCIVARTCRNCNSYRACCEVLSRLVHRCRLSTCLWCRNDQTAPHAICLLNRLWLSLPRGHLGHGLRWSKHL